MHGHSASWDIRIRSRVIEDDEALFIVCGVKLILHCVAKMSFHSMGTFWLACCCIFCMLAYVDLMSHGVSLIKEKRPLRVSMSIKSMM